MDLHRYRSNKRTYREICRTSNWVCRQYGLGESMPTGRRGRSYKENMEYRRGTSWKARLKYSVDRAVWSSVAWEEFLWAMQAAGYEVRQGKYLAFRVAGAEAFYYLSEHGLLRFEDFKNRAADVEAAVSRKEEERS